MEDESHGVLGQGQVPNLLVQGTGSLKQNNAEVRSQDHKSEHVFRKRKSKINHTFYFIMMC